MGIQKPQLEEMEVQSGVRKRKTNIEKNNKVNELLTENSYNEKSKDSLNEKSDKTESYQNNEELIHIKKQPPLCSIHIEIDLVCLVLFALALCTRVYNLEEPKHIVFDELHYGRYITLYTKGIFFFDSHPPLGKQLLYLAGRAAGYDGNFTFDHIGSPYPDNVPIRAMRLVPAVAGSLLIPVSYQLMLELCAYQWTAILAALLMLFENCFLAQSRFMLLESIQILFGLSGVLFTLKSTFKTGLSSVLWLVCAAVSLGCCFSVKYSGLYTYFLCVLLVGRQMWTRFGSPGPVWRLLISTFWRAGVLVCVPACVYVSVMWAHLTMLPRAGPHDSVMTSAFQASLEGGLASITRGQPLHVAHGSQITLRHTHGRACWLHSHAHVYPVRYGDGRGSSHQQQVTCYSFKDVNNWWIVKRPEVSGLAVSHPADVIRHGDVVQLLHGITSRALNSHDVAAPVSPHAQEVSCYIDYNVSMAASNLWRVEVLNRARDTATWDGIRSQVRLIHVSSGGALRYSGRQLPAWGFHQHEVVADKHADHLDAVWNVEEHRYTKAEERAERERELASAEMIPSGATSLSFWAKFRELQHKMVTHAADAPPGHMFASEPADWPLLARPVAYWLSPTSNAQVHLIGNAVTWWAGAGGVLVFAALCALYAAAARRARPVLSPTHAAAFHQAGTVLFVGYWLHYLPYYFVERTLFLHHYLPAYAFKVLLLAWVCEHVWLLLRPRAAAALLPAAALAYVALTFANFSVLNYGTTDLTEADLLRLRWRDSWDFILHKRG